MKSLSRVRLFAAPWTIAYQDPLSMGFSRQEYWSGLPFPSPGDLPNPGIEPRSPALQADASPSKPLLQLSKPLIQFSIVGWSYVPSLLFTWGQTMVEVVKIMATSFKRSHACTAALSAPALQQATADPRLHWRCLDTHRQAWLSLLWGHCSFLLGPGAQGSVVPSKSLVPSPV